MSAQLHFDESLMPKPITCDQCGAQAVIHTIQYVYQPRVLESGKTEHELVDIVAVIECPKCGKRKQNHGIQG